MPPPFALSGRRSLAFWAPYCRGPATLPCPSLLRRTRSALLRHRCRDLGRRGRRRHTFREGPRRYRHVTIPPELGVLGEGFGPVLHNKVRHRPVKTLPQPARDGRSVPDRRSSAISPPTDRMALSSERRATGRQRRFRSFAAFSPPLQPSRSHRLFQNAPR